MERLSRIFYIPYLGRVHPRNACFARSRINNPLEERYCAHISKTREVLNELNRQRQEGRAELLVGAYRDRPWFVRLTALLETVIGHVDEYRRTELDNAQFKKYLVLISALEIICSLILFCTSNYYCLLSDEDIESLRFPLSKSTRMIINKVVIQGDDFKIESNYL